MSDEHAQGEQWTKEPKKTGHYWATDDNYSLFIVQVVHEGLSYGPLVAWEDDSGEWLPLTDVVFESYQWWGPISEPPPLPSEGSNESG